MRWTNENGRKEGSLLVFEEGLSSMSGWIVDGLDSNAIYHGSGRKLGVDPILVVQAMLSTCDASPAQVSRSASSGYLRFLFCPPQRAAGRPGAFPRQASPLWTICPFLFSESTDARNKHCSFQPQI
jgi:hypothetical protein